MNDLEHRLRGTLQAAVPERDLAPGAIGMAVAAAARTRRRRAAARGGIGVAAMVGSGALLVRDSSRPAIEPDRLRATASPTASTPGQVATTGITLRVVDGCESSSLPERAGSCVSYVVEVRRDDGRTTLDTLAWHSAPLGEEPRVATQDPVLGVEVDGVRHTLVGRSTGPREWAFDLVVPAGAKFAVLSLRTEDGSGMTCGSLRNLGDRCG